LLLQSHLPDLQDVLQNICLYNKTKVGDYIAKRAQLEDWNGFAYNLLKATPNALNSRKSVPVSPVTNFVKRACEENYALRSCNID